MVAGGGHRDQAPPWIPTQGIAGKQSTAGEVRVGSGMEHRLRAVGFFAWCIPVPNEVVRKEAKGVTEGGLPDGGCGSERSICVVCPARS